MVTRVVRRCWRDVYRVGDGMRLWYCTECGAVYFRENEPAGCGACDRPAKRTVEHNDSVHYEEGQTTTFDTVEMGGGDVPETVEECPNCGEFVPEGEVTHELGGCWCPECRD